jgi:copper chaperone CopZ
MKKIKLTVGGMHCPSCEMLLKDSLEDAGAKVLDVSHKKGTAIVEYDENRLDEAAIKSIVKREGYEVK